MLDEATVAFAAASATLLLTIVGIVLPPDRVRGVTLVIALALCAILAQNSVPTALWVAGFGLSIAVLVVAEIRSTVRSRGSAIMLGAIMAWWLLIAVGALLQSSFSPSRLVIYALLAVMMAVSLSRTSTWEFRLVINGIVLIACAQTALSVVELAVGNPLIWDYRGGIERMNPFVNDLVARTQGTMAHPIVLGYFEGLALVIAWANPSRLRTAPRLLALGVIAAGLVLSGTRSAALAAAIAIVLHVLLRFRLLLWLRGVVLLASVALVILLLDLGITNLIERTLESGSWAHRLGSLTAIPALVDRPPDAAWWGVGFGGENELYDQGLLTATYGLRAVDNFIVYLLGTTGIVGLVATLVLLLIGFVVGTRATRAMIAFSFGMFFSFDIVVWLFTGLLLFVVLGLAARGGDASRHAVDGPQRTREFAEGPDDPDETTPPPPEDVLCPDPRGRDERGRGLHVGVDRRRERQFEESGPLPWARADDRHEPSGVRVGHGRSQPPLR